MEKHKWIRLITSILIAIALWVYVINVVNPSSTTTIRNIPVTLTGTETLYENNLAIYGKAEYTVDVTVRAARSDLSTLPADNIVATADVSGLTLGQDYITVEVSVPREYTVEDVRYRKIEVQVEELERKTVSVSAITTGSVKGDYEPTVISLYPQTVDVYGAKSLVDSVGGVVVTVNAAALEYENVSSLVLQGQVVDNSGNNLAGVKIVDPEISVEATAYSTKSVNLITGYYGDPWAGASINRISAPETVIIKGKSETLAAAGSEVYSTDINIEGIYEDSTFDIVPILPEGIYLSNRNSSLTLHIDLADTGSIEYFYYPYEVKTTGLADTLTADYSVEDGAYITATVTGPITTLKTMSSADVIISVDGSKFTKGTWTVRLNSSTNISGVNISLSPASVSVHVREK